jgi:hypothetical protein
MSPRRSGEGHVPMHDAAEQGHATDQVEALSDEAIIVRMLSDYAVLHIQSRACR